MRLTLALLLALWASTSEAATKCVNGATGSDATSYAANDGVSTCWQTIGRAAWGSTNRASPNASEAAANGDTVTVATGTYAYSGSALSDRFAVLYNPANQGTSTSSMITFSCAGTCTLTATTLSAPVIGCTGKNYVKWTGGFFLDEANILVTADTGPAVMHNATGCHIEGVTIDGDGGPGWIDNHPGIRFELCDTCIARSNRIYSVRRGSGAGDTHVNGAGIQLYDSDDSVIEHNYITDSGSGISVKGITGVNSQLRSIVRFNRIDDVTVGLYLSGTRDGEIYSNIVTNSEFGVEYAVSTPADNDHPYNDIVANNTFSTMASACFFARSNDTIGVRHWNNICSGSTSYMWYAENDPMPAQSSIDVEHSVYHSYATFYAGTDGTRTFAGFKTAYSHDGDSPVSIDSDPLFANPAGDNYRLCTAAGAPHASCSGASPALALGVDILDLDGDTSTVDAVPAGAYVTGNETIGLLSAASASAPVRLRLGAEE